VGKGPRTIMILAYLLTFLAYRSWQRPGAVTNATLEEFAGMKEVRGSGEAVHVMSVSRHKTAWEGPALITATISANNKKLLNWYVKHVRSRCDPYGQVRALFVAISGEPISNMNQHLQWAAVHYKIRVPVAHHSTQLWKWLQQQN